MYRHNTCKAYIFSGVAVVSLPEDFALQMEKVTWTNIRLQVVFSGPKRSDLNLKNTTSIMKYRAQC